MYLIDTNIFLEFLLAQERTNETIRLFQKIISGDLETSVSRFSLYSIEVILSKNKKAEALGKFLDIIKYSRGIKIISTDVGDDRKIIELMKIFNLDFDDALHYYICKNMNLKIISFDKHFDKTDVKRLEPKEIL